MHYYWVKAKYVTGHICDLAVGACGWLGDSACAAEPAQPGNSVNNLSSPTTEAEPAQPKNIS